MGIRINNDQVLGSWVGGLGWLPVVMHWTHAVVTLWTRSGGPIGDHDMWLCMCGMVVCRIPLGRVLMGIRGIGFWIWPHGCLCSPSMSVQNQNSLLVKRKNDNTLPGLGRGRLAHKSSHKIRSRPTDQQTKLETQIGHSDTMYVKTA